MAKKRKRMRQKNEVGYKLKMFFQEYFSMQNVEKNFGSKYGAKLRLLSKV